VQSIQNSLRTLFLALFLQKEELGEIVQTENVGGGVMPLAQS